MPCTEATETPVKLKIAFLEGYRHAIQETCQKLDANVFKIQGMIEELRDENNVAD